MKTFNYTLRQMMERINWKKRNKLRGIMDGLFGRRLARLSVQCSCQL